MAKIKDRVSSEKRLSEKIANLIPGYYGYKNKETRREADKLLRHKLVRELGEVKNDLSILQDSYVDDLDLELAEGIENLVKSVGAQADEIEHAEGGYSGLFDAIKIQEGELNKMYDFDLSLVNNIGEIKQKAEELCGLVDDERTGDIEKATEELKKKIKNLSEIFEKRTEVMQDIE